LKPGDKLRITLTLSSGKILRYVMVEDKRAACLEPVDIESRQQYSGVLSYYQSVRDAGYYFFLENIPAGTHQLQYEVTVSQEGQFTNGPAMLQCMYQPEMKAYSNSMTVTVKE
jgi:alpha-2-macroglobulin